ncbi:MAG TPA: hypothetical protein VF439_01500 [Candidatus Paceibacterota bacterium]
MRRRRITHTGSIMLLALVFGTIFFVMLGALSGYALSATKLESAKQSEQQAFGVAEAGIEYYRWHLAHFPTDLQNGTGHAGPYAVTIPDPQGGTAGTATLTISANTACGQTTSVNLSSTGTAADDAAHPVTLTARYAKPSVGTYSYILNDSVWAGADRVINGPYHSNGGIHMDGTANAPVTSSQTSWDCDSDFGCSPEQRRAAGVVGDGTNQNLWQDGVPQVDFSAIAANFTNLKASATASGLVFQRVSSGSGSTVNANKGWHLIFNSDGTVTAKQVTPAALSTDAVINPADSSTDYTLIGSETSGTTYTVPANCGLIYVEDNVWIEGTVTSKVTVVAADAVHTGVAPDAILRGNIQYASSDGTDGLTVIAENDVLISADSPQNMTADGLFVAQNGAFGRNLYDCPSSYEPRGTLTILGSTVSNKRTGTKWIGTGLCGSAGTAGYQTRIDAFDRKLSTDPPPFTPNVSTDFELLDWRQQ